MLVIALRLTELKGFACCLFVRQRRKALKAKPSQVSCQPFSVKAFQSHFKITDFNIHHLSSRVHIQKLLKIETFILEAARSFYVLH